MRVCIKAISCNNQTKQNFQKLISRHSSKLISKLITMSTPPSSSSSLGLACYNACRRRCSFFFHPRCIWAQNSTTTLRVDPQATVNIKLTERAVSEHSSRAAGCNYGNPTEDQRHGCKDPAEFSRNFALCDFLDRPAAEKATCAMLSDMISGVQVNAERPPLALYPSRCCRGPNEEGTRMPHPQGVGACQDYVPARWRGSSRCGHLHGIEDRD